MQRSWTGHAAGAIAAVLAAGCSDFAGEGSKAGELGNGSFAFACDDSLPCSKFRPERTSEFPNQVASGATFKVSFTPTKGRPGITLSSVGSSFFSSRGANQFAAVRPGRGTIVARDNTGAVIDFTYIDIVVPDAIAVYDDDSAASNPNPTTVSDVEVTVGRGRSVRAVARKNNEILAGQLEYEWQSGSDDILSVDTVRGIKATLLGKTKGSTTLTVSGGSYQQRVTVLVK